jgi:hypothetical protein
MTEIPKAVSPRPWKAVDAAILTYDARDSAAVPTPENPRPWHRLAGCVVIYDANNQPVSGVRNAAFLFHVEQCHDPVVDALRLARRALLVARRRTAIECYAAEITETLATVNAALKQARGKL